MNITKLLEKEFKRTKFTYGEDPIQDMFAIRNITKVYGHVISEDEKQTLITFMKQAITKIEDDYDREDMEMLYELALEDMGK